MPSLSLSLSLSLHLAHGSPEIPPPPLQDVQATPTYSTSYHPRTSAGGRFSDSASTDDSGICMETNGAPTLPLAPTYDVSQSSPRKEGTLPTEGACNGVYISTSTGGVTGIIANLPSSSDSSFTYPSNEPNSTEQLHQWYTPLSATAAATEKLATTSTAALQQHETSPVNTPVETAASWGGMTRPFVDNSTTISMTSMSMTANAAGGGVALSSGRGFWVT